MINEFKQKNNNLSLEENNSLMSIKQSRKILGPLAEGKSDEEIKEIRDYFDRWAKNIIAAWRLHKKKVSK